MTLPHSFIKRCTWTPNSKTSATKPVCLLPVLTRSHIGSSFTYTCTQRKCYFMSHTLLKLAAFFCPVSLPHAEFRSPPLLPLLFWEQCHTQTWPGAQGLPGLWDGCWSDEINHGGGQKKGELLPTAQDEGTLSWHWRHCLDHFNDFSDSLWTHLSCSHFLIWHGTSDSKVNTE